MCLKDLESKDKDLNQPVHIINIDVADNHEDATLGAFILYELALIVIFLKCSILLVQVNMRIYFIFKLQNTEDMENEIDEILQEYESKIKRPILHSISFY